MHTRTIGNLTVSPIGMGCMGFSHGYGKIPEESYSIEAIRKAYAYGCTFFDTAELYGPSLQHPGHNELIVGKAIESFRKDIVLATKFFVSGRGGSRRLYDVVRNHLEASCKRLRTDYIDLYYLHRVSYSVPVEEVAEVMGRLIDEGLIGGWGLSQVSGRTLKRAHEVTPVTAVQNLYNILERDCEQDIFPYALENNIGVVPFSPVASGLLSGKVTVDTRYEKVDDVRNWVPQCSKRNIIGNQPIVDMLTKWGNAKNATPAQISMAWMLHKYPNVVPIPGSKNQERILENLAAWNISFTDAEFAQFESELSQHKVYGHRGHIEE